MSPRRPKRFKNLTPKQLLLSFLTMVAILLTGLFYITTRPDAPVVVSYEGLESLNAVYQREGMQRYQQEKRALKSQVSKALRKQDGSESYHNAVNIAVYLFPDILPKEDFERDIAQEDWGPLQQAIEQSPNSKESRVLFEEMRANIWNYENASRDNPQLSTAARQTIRLFETMSKTQ